MLTIKHGRLFSRDYKRIKKRHYDLSELAKVIDMLVNEIPLPAKYHDHMLIGNYVGCHECHIGPDWLLVYEIQQEELILHLTRTGTHSDIFI